MNSRLLAAKVKADWLDAKRAYVQLVETNDLDPQEPELQPVRARLRRLILNREYLFAVRDNAEEATEEMMLLRSDSHRILGHVKTLVRNFAVEYDLKPPLLSDYEVSKYASGRNQLFIPPRFIEDEVALVDELRAAGWNEPPDFTMNL